VALLACPFCREMFSDTEFRSAGERVCPVCSVALEPMAKLPLSHDAVALEPAASIPEREVLPFTYLARGRGLLLLCSAIGIVLFFLPWIEMTAPELRDFTGSQLARRQGWPWAAFTAWFVMIPMVLSRRTILSMQGARVAAAFLSLIPTAVSLIYFFRPQGNVQYVTVQFHYTKVLFAMSVLGLVAFAISCFFGGPRTATSAAPGKGSRPPPQATDSLPPAAPLGTAAAGVHPDSTRPSGELVH
jgi:hypothetical protein